MYNSEIPGGQQLPSTAQLLRSTFIALVTALVLLVMVVMPSEYAIDPTGVGRVLGLTQMGEIKEQLAEEAAADLAATEVQRVAPVVAQSSVQLTPVAPAPVTAASPVPVVTKTEPVAVKAEPAVASVTAPVKPKNQHEISFTLVPGQGAEVKLEMKKGAKARFSWTANGGKLNYDTHGDPYNPPKGFYHGYGKGRFQPGDSGELEAAFDGNHGWFWRNRTRKNVVLTLTTEGDYIQLKRVI